MSINMSRSCSQNQSTNQDHTCDIHKNITTINRQIKATLPISTFKSKPFPISHTNESHTSNISTQIKSALPISIGKSQSKMVLCSNKCLICVPVSNLINLNKYFGFKNAMPSTALIIVRALFQCILILCSDWMTEYVEDPFHNLVGCSFRIAVFQILVEWRLILVNT